MKNLNNKIDLEQRIRKEYRLPDDILINREVCTCLLVGQCDYESVDPTSPVFLSELVYNSPRSLYPLLWLQLGYEYTIV